MAEPRKKAMHYTFDGEMKHTPINDDTYAVYVQCAAICHVLCILSVEIADLTIKSRGSFHSYPLVLCSRGLSFSVFQKEL